MGDLIQLTEFQPSHSTLDSQWGMIFYDDWLEREAERIRSRGARAEIRQDGRGADRIALFVEQDTRNK